MQQLQDIMQGALGKVEDLPSLTDWSRVEEVFKLVPSQRPDALSLILGAMAIKGYL